MQMQVDYKEKLYIEPNSLQMGNDIGKILDLKNQSCLMEKARIRNEKRKKAQASHSGIMMTNEIIKWKLKNIDLKQSNFSSANHSFADDNREEKKSNVKKTNKKSNISKIKNYDYNPFLLDNSYNFKTNKNKLSSLTPYLKNLNEKINNKKTIQTKTKNFIRKQKEKSLTNSIVINYPCCLLSENNIFSHRGFNSPSKLLIQDNYKINHYMSKKPSLEKLNILTSPKKSTSILNQIPKNNQNSKSNIFKEEESKSNNEISCNNTSQNQKILYPKTEKNTIQNFFDNKIIIPKLRIKSEVFNYSKDEVNMNKNINFYDKKSVASNTMTYYTPKRVEGKPFLDKIKYEALNRDFRKKTQLKLPKV
jgi:hypothetical protein